MSSGERFVAADMLRRQLDGWIREVAKTPPAQEEECSFKIVAYLRENVRDPGFMVEIVRAPSRNS